MPHPTDLRKFLGGRVLVQRPFVRVRPAVDHEAAAAAAEDIRETNEYLQITEGNAGGRREGKKRFGDQHEWRRREGGGGRMHEMISVCSRCRLASTFGQTRQICIGANEEEEEEDADEEEL